MKRRTWFVALISSVLLVYVSAYVALSIQGRYEPAAFGLNGVKFYAWAPHGFHSHLTWRHRTMFLFSPLYCVDIRFWHTFDAAHSGKYPITAVDRDDIWKYYKAEGLLEESNIDGDSVPVARDSSDTVEHDNRNQAAVSRTADGAPKSVTGMITLDGKAVENATVELIPVDGGKDASGQTDANGQFEVEKGVAPGAYRVRIIHKTSPTRGEGTKTKADTGENSGGITHEVKSGR